MAAKIYAAKCQACDKLIYPTHYYCPECKGRRFDEVPVEGGGVLLTWTRCYSLPLDFAERYITLGIVKMDMGINALGRLSIDQPKTGMRVSSDVGDVRDMDGKEVKGLVFSAG